MMNLSLGIDINSKVISDDSGIITPPLDLYTGAQTAISFARKLRTAYTGYAMKVINEDSAELEVGYDGLDTNETALENHRTGTGILKVITAYDNGLNGNDWTQATDSKRPLIADASGLIKDNGKLAILSDSDDLLTVILTGSATTTAFHVFKTTVNSTITCNDTNNGGRYYGLSKSGQVYVDYAGCGTPTTYVNGSITTTAGELYTALINKQVVNTFTSLNLSAWLEFSTWYGSGFPAPTYIQEKIIYDIDKSSDRADIENNQIAYFSIPV